MNHESEDDTRRNGSPPIKSPPRTSPPEDLLPVKELEAIDPEAASIRLYLIGTGTSWPEAGALHLTPQAREALERCRMVFHLTPFDEELRTVCSCEVVDNTPDYWTGEHRAAVYERIAATVWEAVLDDDSGPVGNAIYGHPLFCDDINLKLIRRARDAGLVYRAIPGVSALDTLSVDLDVDYGDGLQLYEARTLVQYRYAMDKRVHTVIVQAADFPSDTTDPDMPDDPERFGPLIDFLSGVYGPDHLVYFHHCNTGKMGADRVVCKISEIGSYQPKLTRAMTLYIPPSSI